MILYKKDQSGKIRFLEISVLSDVLFQTSGVLGTENPITHEKSCKGKNIGKANETTPQQQAFKEEQSLITEKLQEGYFYTIQEAQTIDTLFPMLAKDYKKEVKKINWTDNVFVQPKLDGMRCLITVTPDKVTLKSRDGRYITTMKHIEKDFTNVTPGIYDGELYAHGYNFQENMELIKKWVDGDDGSILVKFHCYDVVTPGEFSIRLLVRDINLQNISSVEFVPTVKIKSELTLKDHHSKFISDGYEGSIVRHGKEEYKINGRSSNLLKYKDFFDLALVIKDFEPASQRPEWGVPVFEWIGAKDNELRAGMKFSHADRKKFLANKQEYIGKVAELRFFEYSSTGVPRFPVMVGFRQDKYKSDQ